MNYSGEGSTLEGSIEKIQEKPTVRGFRFRVQCFHSVGRLVSTKCAKSVTTCQEVDIKIERDIRLAGSEATVEADSSISINGFRLAGTRACHLEAGRVYPKKFQ